MLTRRDLLVSGIAGISYGVSCGVAIAQPSQPATQVNFPVPAGACDCHTHIIGDSARFPFMLNRAYTPGTALPAELAALHGALHVDRVVIVTPSFYGSDNSATLYGMRARGRSARGVAVIDEHTTSESLDEMERAGFRGIRLNLATGNQNDPALARRLFQASVDRVRRLKWHIQMYTSLAVMQSLKDLIEASPVPVVFDHFCGASASLGVTQPGWSDLISLVRAGKVYVKLSGEYRISRKAPDYSDAAPLAQQLVAANPERILWASDWPHTNSESARPISEVTPFSKIDDGLLFNEFASWVPDAAVRRKILVANPARLYRF